MIESWPGRLYDWYLLGIKHILAIRPNAWRRTEHLMQKVGLNKDMHRSIRVSPEAQDHLITNSNLDTVYVYMYMYMYLSKFNINSPLSCHHLTSEYNSTLYTHWMSIEAKGSSATIYISVGSVGLSGACLC